MCSLCRRQLRAHDALDQKQKDWIKEEEGDRIGSKKRKEIGSAAVAHRAPGREEEGDRAMEKIGSTPASYRYIRTLPPERENGTK